MTQKKLYVAVTMDGNGRWAKERGLRRTKGHERGAERAIELVRAARNMGVNELTLFAFAKANWERDTLEVKFLMWLIGKYISEQTEPLHEENVQFRFIGDRTELSQRLQRLMAGTENRTKCNIGMKLIIAINYSSSWDSVNAARLVAEKVESGGIKASDVDDQLLRQHMSIAGLRDPQIVIRTGLDENRGKDNFYVNRRSDFMTGAVKAVDVAVTEHFPDFTPKLFEDAIASAGLDNLLHGGQRLHRAAAE